jgi:CRISPR-associated protein Cas2
MKENYLVCYDVRNEKRLRKVFKYSKQFGLHLQYSVFLCRFTWQELKDFKNGLKEIIDKRKDDIRIYPLPSEMKVIILGCGDRIPDGVNIFID